MILIGHSQISEVDEQSYKTILNFIPRMFCAVRAKDFYRKSTFAAEKLRQKGLQQTEVGVSKAGRAHMLTISLSFFLIVVCKFAIDYYQVQL